MGPEVIYVITAASIVTLVTASHDPLSRVPGSGFWSIVEARKLEYQYPHALKVKYRGS